MTSDQQKTFELIKLAVSEQYTAAEWLLINLKNPWRLESSPTLPNNHRHILELSEHAAVEVNQYEYTHIDHTAKGNRESQIKEYTQVYIVIRVNHSLRYPQQLSTVIRPDTTLDGIRLQIRDLLANATLELQQLNRGSSNSPMSLT